MTRLEEIKSIYKEYLTDPDKGWLIHRVEVLTQALQDACATIHSDYCSGKCHSLHKDLELLITEGI